MIHFVRTYLDVIWQCLLYVLLLFSGWASPPDIVVIYAIETIVIGIFHAFRMLILTYGSTPDNRKNGLGMTLFFLVHYNMFTFIQTGFFFVFLAMSDERISSGFDFQNFITVLKIEGVQLALLVMLLSQAIRLYFNFIRKADYRNMEVRTYMFVPYLRILVQQFVAIIPGLFILFLDGGFAAAILLILLRSLLDGFLARMRGDVAFINKSADYLVKRSNAQGKTLDRSQVQKFLELVVKY
ncbi:MAG: hypothetical protein A3D92_13975 [Bacteroidetes bacterium RIFCSPHIGHO2_02_FULL_44_7]|nr:MAG: hypothetical protein A3D92_13975 [Bacteroidetes bacterium RIFCSPHIGHO2_02_FULL_44_7]